MKPEEFEKIHLPYLRLDAWVHKPTSTWIMVRRGPDSFRRAQALFANPQTARLSLGGGKRLGDEAARIALEHENA